MKPPPSIHTSPLLSLTDHLRREATAQLDPQLRAAQGQYMTPSPVAAFLASFFETQGQARATDAPLRLLDAGAGVGSLTAAFVEASQQWKSPPRRLEATFFELDGTLIPFLRRTLDACALSCKSTGTTFTAQVRAEDFITAAVAQVRARREAGVQDSNLQPGFDCAILNPPYRKIHSKSPTRLALRSVGIETSNLYSAFLWLTMLLLAPGGELVAIVPRSFCNGPYFRPFRRMLLQTFQLRRVHVFGSRTATFADDAVLQENVILSAVKRTGVHPPVVLSSSMGIRDPDVRSRTVAIEHIVHPNDPNDFIYLPDGAGEDAQGELSRLEATLEDLGLSVSTGRVVLFRARAHLLTLAEAARHTTSVPLICARHLKAGRIQWPRARKEQVEALTNTPETASLRVPSGVYVLVKRLSSKEEKRRIVAAVFDPAMLPASHRQGDSIGFENHLNYFHIEGRGLEPLLAEGLMRYLNSSLVDTAFRQFSGHTQVNAADLRVLRYPTRVQLERLGAHPPEFQNFPDISPQNRALHDTVDPWVKAVLCSSGPADSE